MAWYSIDMPEQSVTDGGYHKLCREFQKAFIGAGAPPEMALFACRQVRAHGRRLYLSPSSPVYVPDLIQCYGAEPCSVPEPESVTLVYGVPGAKKLLSAIDETDVSVDSEDATSDERSATSDLPPAQKRRDVPAIYSLNMSRQAASGG